MLAAKQEAYPLTATAGRAVACKAVRQGWLDAVSAFHRASPHGAVLAVDGAVVAAGATVGGVSHGMAVAASLTVLVAGALTQLYSRRTAMEAQGLGWYVRLLTLPVFASGLLLALTSHSAPKTVVAALAVPTAALIALRGCAWAFIANRRRHHAGLEGVLLVGPPERTTRLAHRIDAFPQAGLWVAACYDTTNTNGQRSRARTLLGEGRVEHVLLVGEHDEEVVRDCARWAKGAPVHLSMALPTGSARGSQSHIGDVRVVNLGRTAADNSLLWAKRVFDVVVSAVVIVLMAPVLGVVALAVWLYDRGPVFYRQRRVGLDSREFMIWKFRSMVPGADRLNGQYASANMASGLLFKIPGDPRITPVGNLIRRLAIDELPQLFNVLVGHMSLVGPRPLPVDPDDFDPVASRRHRMRPGITGPWQVAGGHLLGYDDMINLDLDYIDGWSMRRDLWLMIMTIPAVLGRRAAY